VSDGGRHAAHLAVLALGEFEGEPRVGHGLAHPNRRIAGRHVGRGIDPARHAGERAVVVELESTALEPAERVGGRNVFHLHPILPAMGVARIEQPGVEPGLVAQQQEAFGVGIETAERIDSARKSKLRERAPF
jgi:hypothetical protein